MRENWGLFEAVIPKDDCEYIINDLLNIEPIKATTFGGLDNYRNSIVRWVGGKKYLSDRLMPFVHQVNAEMLNVDIQPSMHEMQFTEYHADYNGKYDWHHDVNRFNPANYDRKLSVVVQLSDENDYEGGDFEFSEVETPTGFKNQGSILIFPSYLEHRVTPVTKGVRYSLVTWLSGPRWR